MKSGLHKMLVFVLSIMMAGCASRYDVSSPEGTVRDARFFSTTERVHQHNLRVEETFNEMPAEVGILGGFIVLGGILYSFSALIAASATDVLLSPVDALAVWQEHQQNEESLKLAEEKAVESPVAEKTSTHNPKRENKGSVSISDRKRLLLAQCRGRELPYWMEWPTPRLEEILREDSGPAICLPAACACGKPIDPIEAAKHVQRTDQNMSVKTSTHEWDGIAFCRNNCECGQYMIVRFPLQIHSRVETSVQ
jgi:hypothetical protein